jgi:hypothetical protein
MRSAMLSREHARIGHPDLISSRIGIEMSGGRSEIIGGLPVRPRQHAWIDRLEQFSERLSGAIRRGERSPPRRRHPKSERASAGNLTCY